MILPKRILILSPEHWGTSFVSKHHYASLLASKGVEVFFAGSPIDEKAKTVSSSQTDTPNLKTLSYPRPLKGVNRLPVWLRKMYWKRLAREIVKETGELDWVWSFDPYVFQDLSGFGKDVVKIYHPVDVHRTDLEFDCVRSADVVFSTAHKILEKFGFDRVREISTQFQQPMQVIHHGLGLHFLNPESPDFILPDADKYVCKVGYVGNLNYLYMDYPILFQLIEENPTVGFYFIGPYEGGNLGGIRFPAEIEQLKQYSNTFLLGPKPSQPLPKWLQLFDMFLMTYRAEDDIAHMANPHKILEYLSTGKVAVTHYIDEYADKRHLFEMVEKNKDLPAKFKEVVGDLDSFNAENRQKVRIDFACENTYEHQLERINFVVSRKS